MLQPLIGSLGRGWLLIHLIPTITEVFRAIFLILSFKEVIFCFNVEFIVGNLFCEYNQLFSNLCMQFRAFAITAFLVQIKAILFCIPIQILYICMKIAFVKRKFPLLEWTRTNFSVSRNFYKPFIGLITESLSLPILE